MAMSFPVKTWARENHVLQVDMKLETAVFDAIG